MKIYILILLLFGVYSISQCGEIPSLPPACEVPINSSKAIVIEYVEDNGDGVCEDGEDVIFGRVIDSEIEFVNFRVPVEATYFKTQLDLTNITLEPIKDDKNNLFKYISFMEMSLEKNVGVLPSINDVFLSAVISYNSVISSFQLIIYYKTVSAKDSVTLTLPNRYNIFDFTLIWINRNCIINAYTCNEDSGEILVQIDNKSTLNIDSENKFIFLQLKELDFNINSINNINTSSIIWGDVDENFMYGLNMSLPVE